MIMATKASNPRPVAMHPQSEPACCNDLKDQEQPCHGTLNLHLNSILYSEILPVKSIHPALFAQPLLFRGATAVVRQNWQNLLLVSRALDTSQGRLLKRL